ncbi:MAG: S8 family serine peptidase [Verrucomicrobiota bacterium]|nr:S8 family serine peptidase [Verrucomicrobiota bacterium]
MNQKSTIFTLSITALGILMMVFFLFFNYARRNVDNNKSTEIIDGLDLDFSVLPDTDIPLIDSTSRLPFASSALDALRKLLAALAADSSALRNEVILRFTNEVDYNDFLKVLSDRNLRLLGSSDRFMSMRIGFENYGDLFGELANLDPSGYELETNFLVSLPGQPGTGDSPGAGEGAIPFGRDALKFIGIGEGNLEFGKGIKVAVIDSGIQEHETFSGKNILEYDLVRDVNGNLVPIDSDNGHGTAVASIIGGSDSRYSGVAPGVEILSYRVLDNDGYSDSYTLAKAIIQAADSGADIINISLGSKGDSGIVRRAVDYANDAGVLIVAATGNEGVNAISFPAAIEGVVAVTANDALGQHVDFANSGNNLQDGGMTAPGYAVWAAWPEGEAVSFSGTSASAPFVSGAVAAVMSENQGMSAFSAYELLQKYSNEAGAPGNDIVYGAGNLNLGRVLERNVPNITDAGLASYYYDPASAELSGQPNTAQVVVENRGTTALHNLTVQVDSGSTERNYNVSFIPVGEIAVIETPSGFSSDVTEEGLAVSATVIVNENLNGKDRDVSDNSLSKTIELNSSKQP